MAEISKISWCDLTLNFWEGCTKVSEGCLHCYAENRDQRFHDGQHWGKGAPRKKSLSAVTNCRRFSKNAEDGRFITCAACGTRRWRSDTCCGSQKGRLTRPIAFVMSLGDFLDEEVPDEWRAEALTEILKAEGVDFMILTKRPEAYAELFARASLKMTPAMREKVLRWLDGTEVPAHIALGTTVESDKTADRRLYHLAKIPAARRFISAEPLLSGRWSPLLAGFAPGTFHLVIAGGESGAQARPMHPAWAHELERQCDRLDIPFHFKQWGEWTPSEVVEPDWTRPITGNFLVVYPDRRVEAYDPDRSPESYAPEAVLMHRTGKKKGGHACGATGRTRTEFLTFPTAPWRHEWWEVDGTNFRRRFPGLRFASEYLSADPRRSGFVAHAVECHRH